MNPTPQSSLSEREAVEARRQTETARVVVVDDNKLPAAALAAALKGASDTMSSTPAGHRPCDPSCFRGPRLLRAGRTADRRTGDGRRAVQRNLYAEVNVYGDDPDAPEVSAGAVLGITRIVPAQSMAAWLAHAGGLLARGAYLRRLAAATVAIAPEPPRLETSALDATRLPLPTAEMRFRESYIRCLLTQSGSRQEAARRAGVPYRTMCEMIRKLGISTK